MSYLIEKSEFISSNPKQLMMNAVRDIIFREKKDFNEITVKGICEKAAISRRSFYRYYKNKNDLIYEMIIHDLDGFEGLIDAIIEKPISPIEKLKLLQKQLEKTYFEDFTQNVIDHFRLEAPKFWEINIKRFGNIMAKFLIVVKQGIEDGSFKKDTDPAMVIFLLYCCSNLDLNEAFLPPSTYTQSMIINKFFDILFNGIINRSTDYRENEN